MLFLSHGLAPLAQKVARAVAWCLSTVSALWYWTATLCGLREEEFRRQAGRFADVGAEGERPIAAYVSKAGAAMSPSELDRVMVQSLRYAEIAGGSEYRRFKIGRAIETLARLPNGADREAVVSGIVSLKGAGIHEAAEVAVLESLAKIPRDRRGEVLEGAKLCLGQDSRLWEITGVIDDWAKLSAADRPVIMASLKRVIEAEGAGAFSTEDRSALLRQFAQLLPSERERVIEGTLAAIRAIGKRTLAVEWMAGLRDGVVGSRFGNMEISVLVASIRRFPQGERLLTSLLRYLTPETEDSQCYALLETMMHALEEGVEIEHHLPQTLRLIAPGETRAMIRAVQQIPSAHVEEIASQALRLMNPHMGGVERVAIVSCLAEKRGAWTEIVDAAVLCISGTDDGFSVTRVVDAVALLDPARRLEIAQGVQKLIDAARPTDLSGTERTGLFRKLSQVPHDRRGVAVDVLARWIGRIGWDWEVVTEWLEGVSGAREPIRNLNSALLSQLVGEIWGLPNGEQILIAAARLFRSRLSWWVCYDQVNCRMRRIVQAIRSGVNVEGAFIEALRLLPNELPIDSEATIEHILTIGGRVENMEEVVSQTLRLISDQMDEGDRLFLLARVSERGIDPADRESIIDFSLRLITPEMRAFGRGAIVDSVGRVAPRDRRSVVTGAVALIEAAGPLWPFAWSERRSLLVELARIPFLHRREQAVAEIIGRMARLEGPEAVIREIARWNAVQEIVLPRVGIDVHRGDRDGRTRNALIALVQQEERLSREEIERSVEEFLDYLRGLRSPHRTFALQARALRTLQGPRKERDNFPPLFDEQYPVTIQGYEISGWELIGRLWRWIGAIRDPVDRESAQQGMVEALADADDPDTGLVCHAGKAQRLAVSVLQGRLPGMEIDVEGEEEWTGERAAALFFMNPAHQQLQTQRALEAAAEQFLQDNPAIRPVRIGFLGAVRRFAALQELPLE
jgi:hypothetical protein